VIRRIISAALVLWVFGFLWFAVALPQPAGAQKTDAIVVPTGGVGRIPRGLAMLRARAAPRMLVTGVDAEVRPREFAAEYSVPAPLMACCVTLGTGALDTRGNARETADWVGQRKVRSIRLVTSDWHMRRATYEFDRVLGHGYDVVPDAVRSEPSFLTLFGEYNKYVLRRLAVWVDL